MPVTLTCPLGHAWEEAVAPDGRTARCPVCGVTVAVRGAAPAEPGDADTVANPLDWRPLPPPSGETPPVLADFEILGELGRGGMGIVWKARWKSEDRVVALKVIRQDRLQHEESVRRFRREAQAAARLHHPNIVQVFDSDHTGDTHYLVMELVEGVTLERLVEQRGPLPIAQACDFIRQAALALQHAHEQGLVHRDIKPANLMAIGNVVKILDMGVVRMLRLAGGGNPTDSLNTLTQGGSVIGTADYIAPEQLENPHGADIRADLYSLGCTFFYLLTGQVPFPGGTLISKLDKQRWETPRAVDELRVEIPAAVASVVRNLLAKKPEERFQTPAELAHTLEDLACNGFTGVSGPKAIHEVKRLKGHADVVAAVAWSADGKRMLSGGKDRLLRLWDSKGGLIREFARQHQEIRAIALAPRGDRMAWAGGVGIRLGDPHSGLEQGRLSGHSDHVRSIVFTGDGQRLVSAAEDKTVRLWDVAGAREIQRMAKHGAGVTSVAVTADGNVALSGGRDQTLRVWDLRNGQELRSMAPSAGTVLAVALTPDGRFAASAHFDTLVRLWDVAAGRELRRFLGHKQMVGAIAFTPDGKRLVTGSQDQTVRLWQVDSGLELAHASLGAGVTALGVAPDGKRVLAAGLDKEIVILELPGS